MGTYLARYGLALLGIGASLCACTSPVDDSTSGTSAAVSTYIPSDGVYYLTTFGGPSEPQPVSCGGNTNGGTWYYTADRQRFGCGTLLQIEANGNCVIGIVADTGPATWVENNAGAPIIDASPLISMALFNNYELGWSDHAAVQVSVADPSAQPGETCGGQNAAPPTDDNTDPNNPNPNDSSGWNPDWNNFNTCYDAYIDWDVWTGECAPLDDSGTWYQCYDGQFYSGVDSNGYGPFGPCTYFYGSGS
jgi:hypothetical protein